MLGWLMVAFESCETHFSEKLVLSSEITSFGFVTLYTLSLPRDTSRRSATNSMYWHIRSEFMPISLHGRCLRSNTLVRERVSARWWYDAPVRSSYSILTALVVLG